jgi:hypothetical protein
MVEACRLIQDGNGEGRSMESNMWMEVDVQEETCPALRAAK